MKGPANRRGLFYIESEPVLIQVRSLTLRAVGARLRTTAEDVCYRVDDIIDVY